MSAEEIEILTDRSVMDDLIGYIDSKFSAMQLANLYNNLLASNL